MLICTCCFAAPLLQIFSLVPTEVSDRHARSAESTRRRERKHKTHPSYTQACMHMHINTKKKHFTFWNSLTHTQHQTFPPSLWRPGGQHTVVWVWGDTPGFICFSHCLVSIFPSPESFRYEIICGFYQPVLVLCWRIRRKEKNRATLRETLSCKRVEEQPYKAQAQEHKGTEIPGQWWLSVFLADK